MHLASRQPNRELGGLKMFKISFGTYNPIPDSPRLTDRCDVMHQIISPAICLVGQCLNCTATPLPNRKVPSQDDRRFYRLCNKEMPELIRYQVSSVYFGILRELIQQVLLTALRVFSRPSLPEQSNLLRVRLRMKTKLRPKETKHPLYFGV